MSLILFTQTNCTRNSGMYMYLDDFSLTNVIRKLKLKPVSCLLLINEVNRSCVN